MANIAATCSTPISRPASTLPPKNALRCKGVASSRRSIPVLRSSCSEAVTVPIRK